MFLVSYVILKAEIKLRFKKSRQIKASSYLKYFEGKTNQIKVEFMVDIILHEIQLD